MDPIGRIITCAPHDVSSETVLNPSRVLPGLKSGEANFTNELAKKIILIPQHLWADMLSNHQTDPSLFRIWRWIWWFLTYKWLGIWYIWSKLIPFDEIDPSLFHLFHVLHIKWFPWLLTWKPQMNQLMAITVFFSGRFCQIPILGASYVLFPQLVWRVWMPGCTS